MFTVSSPWLPPRKINFSMRTRFKWEGLGNRFLTGSEKTTIFTFWGVVWQTGNALIRHPPVCLPAPPAFIRLRRTCGYFRAPWNRLVIQYLRRNQTKRKAGYSVVLELTWKKGRVWPNRVQTRLSVGVHLSPGCSRLVSGWFLVVAVMS